MNEKKERIKKFFRDHSDALVIAAIVLGGTAPSTTASYVSVKRGVEKFSIALIEHDSECTKPIWVTYKNGNTETYHPRPKKTA